MAARRLPAGKSARVDVVRLPRGSRRKQQTREKLLDAAFRLFAARGVDGVAINEITELADVGFGSFYNHFESKAALYDCIVDQVFGAFGSTLERLTANIADPAEVISVCVRHTIQRARAEPLWGSFLLREALRPEAMTRGLGSYLLRDLERGLASKRLRVADLGMALMMTGGTVMTIIATESAVEAGVTLPRALAFSESDVASRCAASLLGILGVDRDEAVKLSRRPLPAEAEPSLTRPSVL